MALGSKRAILVARCGAGRVGATRCGFVPKDTAQATTGAPGRFYLWREVIMPTAVWTTIKE